MTAFPIPTLLVDHERRPYVRQPGPGVARAAERLRKHRAQWDGVSMAPLYSRQQVRADERKRAKADLSARKKAAMRNPSHLENGKRARLPMGGAAAAR
jgi:hypothetical protein